MIFSLFVPTVTHFRHVLVNEDDDNTEENADYGNVTDPEARAIRARREQRRKEKEEAEKQAVEAAQRAALEKEKEIEASAQREAAEREAERADDSSSGRRSPSEPSSGSSPPAT